MTTDGHNRLLSPAHAYAAAWGNNLKPRGGMIILNRIFAVAMYMLTIAVALVLFRDNTAEMVGFGDIIHVDKIYEPTCVYTIPTPAKSE